MVQCPFSWFEDRLVLCIRALLHHVIWGLWLTKNNMIFEANNVTIYIATHKMRVSFQGFWKSPSRKAWRVIKEIYINQETASGFCNEANQRTLSIWARVLLYLNSSNYFHLKWCVGHGSNAKVEFFALWMLLNFTATMGLEKFQILGDSKTPKWS